MLAQSSIGASHREPLADNSDAQDKENVEANGLRNEALASYSLTKLQIKILVTLVPRWKKMTCWFHSDNQ